MTLSCFSPRLSSSSPSWSSLHLSIFPPSFASFLHLPPSPPSLSLQGKVAQTACMSACKHLSTSLMQMLLDTELKQISMGAIQQFNLDVIQCECEYKQMLFLFFYVYILNDELVLSLSLKCTYLFMVCLLSYFCWIICVIFVKTMRSEKRHIL